MPIDPATAAFLKQILTAYVTEQLNAQRPVQTAKTVCREKPLNRQPVCKLQQPELFAKSQPSDDERLQILQMEANYNDDMKMLSKQISQYDDDIAKLKMTLKQINGSRGAAIKKYKIIEAKRAELHKEWCFNYSGR